MIDRNSVSFHIFRSNGTKPVSLARDLSLLSTYSADPISIVTANARFASNKEITFHSKKPIVSSPDLALASQQPSKHSHFARLSNHRN
jgi:hypothetical protein